MDKEEAEGGLQLTFRAGVHVERRGSSPRSRPQQVVLSPRSGAPGGGSTVGEMVRPSNAPLARSPSCRYCGGWSSGIGGGGVSSGTELLAPHGVDG